MPDIGQVRTACYRVMRLQGLAGVTTPAVAAMMKNVGVRPGSYRDLHPMVLEWRSEQTKITKLPPHVTELANAFAKTVWEIAHAAAIETQLQQGEPEPEPRRRRKTAEGPRGPGRIHALQRAVEYQLRPGGPVAEPISGADLLLKLTDRQAGLTDEDHFTRDLLKIAERHQSIYRLSGSKGKWWWRGRDLPDGYAPDGKKQKRYIRTGSPLSVVRSAHETLKNDVMAALAKAKQGLTKGELADDQYLNIPEDKRKTFFAMLRNHLRAEPENKLWELAGGKYRLLKQPKSQ